jgi:hypothetical protein
MADIDSARTEGRVMDYETTLRCIGFAIDFIQILALPVLLLAITWRLAR